MSVSKKSIVCLYWLLAFCCSSIAMAKPKPIYAVGDLHADLSSAQKTFQMAGIVDQSGHWILSDSIVVQTGDLTDRGPDGEPLLEWMRQLEAEASQFNSQFIILMGNHEAMNLQGDWRYVSQADIASFGGLEPRKQAFSLSQKGKWATWLIDKQAVVQIDGTVFVHGGVSKHYARPAESLSTDVKMALLGLGPREILGELGPLWYRGYWQQSEVEACLESAYVLKELGAKRLVMGHTTQRDGRVHSRCNHTLFAIDTGISRHYGEHPAALRIENDVVFAIYPSGEERLTP